MSNKTSEMEQTSVDDVLTKFKLSGRYHLRLITLIFLSNLSNCLFCSNYIFVADKVSYRCKDERFANNTCSNLSNTTEVCTEWVYDDPHSFVSEFQLACQDWKRTLVGTTHSFGYMMGLLIVGPLSDRIGRKKTIIVTGILGAVFGVARSLTSSYWCYIILQFMEALIGDPFSPCFILTMEMVPREKRILTKMVCSFGSSMGYIWLPMAAWLFPYWRHLLIFLYAPAFLFFSYKFLIDESARWLLSKGRKDEAVSILRKAATRNKLNLDEKVIDNLSFEENPEVPLIDLLKDTLKSKKLRNRFFICVIWWSTCTFVHFGMKINSVFLPGNKYINYSLLACADVPAKIIIAQILIRFRRKVPLMSCFIGSAIFILIRTFVPQTHPWLSVTLFMASHAMGVAYFTTTYIYTSELFPTYTRNSMHALCSSLGRIGSIIAPQTPLLVKYWENLPAFVFGCASLVAGLATMFAPDTADDALPDTVRQAEALGGKKVEKEDDCCKKNCTKL